jgi:Putative prokaryotic signal transducing protein
LYRFCSAANLPEAHLLVGLLAQAGIEARVFNEHAQGGLGEIPFTQAWPEIWLEDERDVALAEKVLAQYECTADHAPRRCTACGEQNPGNFDVCWQCGAPLT